MVRAGLLIGFLLIFWLVLSGHYTAWLIGSGIVSAILLALFAARMDSLDDEGVPIEFLPGALTYFPWLFWEIVKSTWDVTKIILNPSLPISPTMVRVRYSQKTPVGLTTYANSITLTPGTISTVVSARDRYILVHALTADGAEATAEGTMDERVAAFEGKSS